MSDSTWPTPDGERLAEVNPAATMTALRFTDDGTIPNHPRLPLLVYHGALKLSGADPAAIVERVFAVNRWGDSWRDGIYPFHHYHSITHEALGVFRGSAVVRFGGERGQTLKVAPGDVVIIPAGVGHKNLGASHDFSVVGAYPDGRDLDLKHGRAEERPAADAAILRVPLPSADPVYGAGGPLFSYWQGG